MKNHSTVLAVAALLVFGAALPGHAEDATAAKIPPAPAASQTGAPPASVARPSLAPKTTAEPAPSAAAVEPAPDYDQRTAGRHRRHGRFRIAHWRPFAIHLPRFHRHRIHWRRI
jgi:hypothetical protein